MPSFEAQPYKGVGWRLVEAQHAVSTLKLVDDLAEQALLENLIEETKPLVPTPCRHLDYLLATPFRYDAAYPRGSRFRRAGRNPGVFYASELVETAVAEMAFYRLLFFIESPATPWADNAPEFTAFSAAITAARGIDLCAPPLSRKRKLWTHSTDYFACQALADAAREADIAVIRYQSVRDPKKGANLAVLDCAAFAKPHPLERRTWRLRFSASGVQAISEFPHARIQFDRRAFSSDPRVAEFDWKMPPR